MDLSVGDIGFDVARMGSKANIGDKPSRVKFKFVELFADSYMGPMLPSWTVEVWNWPIRDVITTPLDGGTPL
jgi:hypothetical protein